MLVNGEISQVKKKKKNVNELNFESENNDTTNDLVENIYHENLLFLGKYYLRSYVWETTKLLCV